MAPKHFLAIKDFSPAEVRSIIDDALLLKADLKSGVLHSRLSGKSVAMIFQKPSNRTRVSFEVGISQLGAQPLMLKEEEIGMGVRETIADVSRVLSRYVDMVMIRPFYHSDIEEFATHSSVPIINGLSDLYHPCQACADMLTVLEHKGEFKGLKACWIGDGNNVCNSFVSIAAKLGVETTVCCPPGYEPTITHDRGSYSIVHNPREAVVSADIVVTDVWVSMAAPDAAVHGVSDFIGYTVTEELLALADSEVIFMHCLPAHRGEEVEAAVVDGPRSVVFDEAENRLHAQKAIMSFLFN